MAKFLPRWARNAAWIFAAPVALGYAAALATL